jgi:6-phosphogluconate dehydrogenase
LPHLDQDDLIIDGGNSHFYRHGPASRRPFGQRASDLWV